MAHPEKKSAAGMHEAKLRRMTAHYGAADPAANILSPDARLKGEGGEEAVGFGADSSAATAKGDRPARKTMAANPVATYQRGGAVGRARGGRTRHKGSTHVNVIVAPNAAPAPTPGPVAGMNPAVPPPMPPKPPMAGPMPGAAPALPMPPGAVPPGAIPPRARGGKVAHSDEAQDKALIHKVLRDEGLERSDKPERARGGRLQKHEMTAGAMTGEGRLEKIGKKPKSVGPVQAV